MVIRFPQRPFGVDSEVSPMWTAPPDLGGIGSGPDNTISIFTDPLILSSSDFSLIFDKHTSKIKP